MKTMGRLRTHNPVVNFSFTEKKQKSMNQSGFVIEKSLILPRINNLSENSPMSFISLQSTTTSDRMSHYRVKW